MDFILWLLIAVGAVFALFIIPICFEFLMDWCGVGFMSIRERRLLRARDREEEQAARRLEAKTKVV